MIRSLQAPLALTKTTDDVKLLRLKSERIMTVLRTHTYLGQPFMKLYMQYASDIHLTITTLHLKPSRLTKNLVYLREAVLMKGSS